MRVPRGKRADPPWAITVVTAPAYIQLSIKSRAKPLLYRKRGERFDPPFIGGAPLYGLWTPSMNTIARRRQICPARRPHRWEFSAAQDAPPAANHPARRVGALASPKRGNF